MNYKKRGLKISKVFLFVFLLCFLLGIIKLFYIALSSNVEGVNLTELASKRNNVKKTLYASRGKIYDVKGDILAQNANSYTLIAVLSSSATTDEDNPNHVVDKEYTAKCLADVLNMDYNYALKRLNTNNVYQVEFGLAGKEISENKKQEIDALNLPGIGFSESIKKRYYPKLTNASYIVGYARRTDSGEIIGDMGIEMQYNDVLKGTNGITEYERDAYGYQMGEAFYTKEPISGSDIYLTIDSQIELILEEAVNSLEKDNTFSWFTISVMNAKTGAIVGSASSPSFDPNNLGTLTSYVNPLIGYTYEPGSTMKIFSFLAAMENGLYEADEKYLSGNKTVKGGTIYDFNRKGWGQITYETGFWYSSNVAASNLALKLGKEKLTDFYKSLGFGKKTGIELPGEEAGGFNIESELDLVSASFGQAITTTPIQTLQALSVLTNDGVMLKPYIVDKIVDEKGNITYQGKRTELGKKVSEESIKTMNELMYGVVYKGLTNVWQVENVTLSGKTGTAQIAGSSGYLKGDTDYIRSFAGIFPYDNPQYIVYASVKQINNGANALAKVLRDAIAKIANYTDVADVKTELDLSKLIDIPQLISLDVKESEEKLKKLGLNVSILGTGKYIINMYPIKGTKVLKESRVFLLTDNNDYIMPDISSWSSSDIINFCNLIGLKFSFTGYGKVIKSSIEYNSKINLDTTLEITLGDDKNETNE